MHTSPENFTTVFPYLFVDGAEQYIEYLVKGLGGKEVHRTSGASGTVANSQVVFGDTTIMISEREERFARSHVSLYLYTEDADELMAQALAAGGTLQMPVSDMDYGDRQGGVIDPQGNIWWISQRIVT